MQPTPEQVNAVELFETGDTLVVKAGAGTGKTTTLASIGRSTQRPGTYIAFNRAIAAEAGRKFPMNVQSSTMHSLAFRRVGNMLNARARLDAPRVAGWQLAKRMGLNGPFIVTVGDRRKVLQPGYLAGHVMKAVSRFCQTGDPEPTERHFPRIEGIDLADSNGHRDWRNNDALARELIGYLHDAWADLINERGQLRFTHDVYLKFWQLGRFEIPGEFILFDEAQDANGVMLAVLADQGGKQIVYVGDSQQQIYEWRGALNALDRIDGNVSYLTQSFRFGPAVADIANLVLTELDADLRLSGTPTIASTIGPIERPSAVLCRSNAMAVQQVLGMQRLGLMPFLVGGADDIVKFANAAAALQNGQSTTHPELACFDTWTEVQDYVADDPQGDELRMMVNLLDEYGPQIVLDALSGLAGEDHADVIVSTAHKAKGREWPAVRLAPDFAEVRDKTGRIPPSEWRLMYVAATRARDQLDVSWSPIEQLIGNAGAA